MPVPVREASASIRLSGRVLRFKEDRFDGDMEMLWVRSRAGRRLGRIIMAVLGRMEEPILALLRGLRGKEEEEATLRLRKLLTLRMEEEEVMHHQVALLLLVDLPVVAGMAASDITKAKANMGMLLLLLDILALELAKSEKSITVAVVVVVVSTLITSIRFFLPLMICYCSVVLGYGAPGGYGQPAYQSPHQAPSYAPPREAPSYGQPSFQPPREAPGYGHQGSQGHQEGQGYGGGGYNRGGEDISGRFGGMNIQGGEGRRLVLLFMPSVVSAP